MPFGYLAGTVLFAWCTAMALVPFRRPRRLALFSWISALTFSEVPHLAFLLLAFATALAFAEGDIDSAGAWLTVGLAVAVSIGLLWLVRRTLAARPVVAAALREGLGDEAGKMPPAKLPWPRILFAPLLFRRGDVERIRDLAYGQGTKHRLDIYRHRSRPERSPVLIYFHGGGFTGGAKSREARALLYRLASEGWLCISANYRTARKPADAFPECLVDVKRAINWVRSEGLEYGADPDRVLLAGSSAGAHLSAMAALTANDPRFQTGFEQSDTSVTAAVCLYGYYGRLDEGGRREDQLPSSPFDHLKSGAAAPPVLIAHGDNDTYASVERARKLAAKWEEAAAGANPVVYIEPPGAQHSFDVFHSIRFDTLVEGIVAFARFTTGVRSAPPYAGPRL